MPNMATITVNDGATTPLAHSFTPQTTNGTEATFWNRNSTIPQGYESLTVSVRGPGSSKTAAHRITGTIVLPGVSTVEGQDAVTRVSKFDFSFSVSQLATQSDRKNLLALASNLFATAEMKTAVHNLEPFY